MAIRPTNKIGNWTPGKTLSEMSQDPLRAVRAYMTQGLSEAPRATGKPGWDPMLKMGPPGGATPLIPQIANPYEQVAGQAATGLGGMLPKYGELYGTGSGAVSGLIGDLQKQARGEAGPGMSLGQALLQQGLTQNIGAVQSQLASQRGLSPAIRARLAAQQTAALQGQSAQQAGLMGLQQQLAAQQQLGQLGMGAAQLGSESQIRGTGTLTGAATDIAKTQAAIAHANQAAQAADKARTVQAATSVLGAGGQLLSKGATSQPTLTGEDSASFTGEQTAGPDTYGQGGANQYRTYAAHGGRIDGTAPYAGDTPKNDVVKANLSPGEIVIPRSAAGSKKAAKAFIEALDDWDEEPSYGKVLKARQKKNYADGGVVPSDEEIARMYAPKPEQMLTTPIPAAQKMKESFDQFLTERVVDPLAQRGYPTLGAALATVPSTAMEYFVPGTPQEAMAGVIPFPGAKGGKKTSKVAKEIAEDVPSNIKRFFNFNESVEEKMYRKAKEKPITESVAKMTPEEIAKLTPEEKAIEGLPLTRGEKLMLEPELQFRSDYEEGKRIKAEYDRKWRETLEKRKGNHALFVSEFPDEVVSGKRVDWFEKIGGQRGLKQALDEIKTLNKGNEAFVDKINYYQNLMKHYHETTNETSKIESLRSADRVYIDIIDYIGSNKDDVLLPKLTKVK